MLTLQYFRFVLSQVLGVYLVIMSIILLSRKSFYSSVIKKMKAENETIILAASIGVLFGIVLVGAYNTWKWDPVLMVTLFSWLVLILSVLWLLDTQKMITMTQKVCSGRGYFAVVGIMFILGLMFVFRGLFIFIAKYSIPALPN